MFSRTFQIIFFLQYLIFKRFYEFKPYLNFIFQQSVWSKHQLQYIILNNLKSFLETIYIVFLALLFDYLIYKAIFYFLYLLFKKICCKCKPQFLTKNLGKSLVLNEWFAWFGAPICFPEGICFRYKPGIDINSLLTLKRVDMFFFMTEVVIFVFSCFLISNPCLCYLVLPGVSFGETHFYLSFLKRKRVKPVLNALWKCIFILLLACKDIDSCPEPALFLEMQVIFLSNFIPEKNIKIFGVTETLFQNTTPTSLVDAWGIQLKETTMAIKEVQQEYTSKRTLNKSIEI